MTFAASKLILLFDMAPLIIHLSSASIKLAPAIPIHAHCSDSRNYKTAIQSALHTAALNQPVPTIGFQHLAPSAIPYILTMVNHYKLDIYLSCSITKQNVTSVKAASLMLKIPELTKLVTDAEEGFATYATDDGLPSNSL